MKIIIELYLRYYYIGVFFENIAIFNFNEFFYLIMFVFRNKYY
jgi:hypothetical protein